MFGFNKRKIENEMAAWLAHPTEFGVPPKTVHFKASYRLNLVTYGPTTIHLVEYVMPDGTAGRGFVNGSLTWSFLGLEIAAIDDKNLLVAYCGWAWLFPPLQSGKVLTEFESDGEEARFLADRQNAGVSEMKIAGRYKIGTSELFEFTGSHNGKPVRGAGNTETGLMFYADDPRYHLPAIYFVLGQQVMQG